MSLSIVFSIIGIHITLNPVSCWSDGNFDITIITINMITSTVSTTRGLRRLRRRAALGRRKEALRGRGSLVLLALFPGTYWGNIRVYIVVT